MISGTQEGLFFRSRPLGYFCMNFTVACGTGEAQ